MSPTKEMDVVIGELWNQKVEIPTVSLQCFWGPLGTSSLH